MTPAQSPGDFCWNNRTVGYHGLSVRPDNQRQHWSYRFKIHTGLPSAPARCAIEVSTLSDCSAMIPRNPASSRSVKPSRRDSNAAVRLLWVVTGQFWQWNGLSPFTVTRNPERTCGK